MSKDLFCIRSLGMSVCVHFFINASGAPLSFCTKPCPNLHLDSLIKKFGGQVVEVVGPHTVLLVPNKCINDCIKVEEGPNTFSFTYIIDCVVKEELLPLKLYWVHQTRDFDLRLDPQDVMLGTLTWTSCITTQHSATRYEEHDIGSSHSEESEGDAHTPSSLHSRSESGGTQNKEQKEDRHPAEGEEQRICNTSTSSSSMFQPLPTKTMCVVSLETCKEYDVLTSSALAQSSIRQKALEEIRRKRRSVKRKVVPIYDTEKEEEGEHRNTYFSPSKQICQPASTSTTTTATEREEQLFIILDSEEEEEENVGQENVEEKKEEEVKTSKKIIKIPRRKTHRDPHVLSTRPSTYTFTHTSTHTPTHTSTNTPTHTSTFISTHTFTRPFPRTSTPLSTHTYTRPSPRTSMPLSTHTSTRPSIHTFTHIPSHTYTLTHTPIHTPTPTSHRILPPPAPIHTPSSPNPGTSKGAENSCPRLPRHVQDCPLMKSPRIYSARSGHYSLEEDLEIIQYLDRHDEYKRLSGSDLWEEMNYYFNGARSWQSLKERFRKRIKRDINDYLKYGLSHDIVERVKAVAVWQEEPVQVRSRQRREYTLDEDLIILRFISDNIRFSEITGVLLWQDMANKCVELSGRTWGSLKGRYLKCIKPNIEKYGLQPSMVMKFLCKNHPDTARERRKRPPSPLSSDTNNTNTKKSRTTNNNKTISYNTTGSEDEPVPLQPSPSTSRQSQPPPAPGTTSSSDQPTSRMTSTKELSFHLPSIHNPLKKTKWIEEIDGC